MDSHTLVQALIYLGSAALIVPIAVRLGLGSVLGYLIAGCIIGPWGLRLVTDAESILHFAEIGVVLMLFIIGLELDPQRLWKLRAAVFGGGALQMVKEHFPHLQIIARARDVDHYICLRQAGVEKPERETFEGALKTGRLALESLGLGPYEARERADVFRRFNIQMVEEMAMVENDTKARAAVYKRTSAMLSEIITEDREHLSLIQRHGWQGTEEGKHTGNMADEPETKPSS
ncbi:cation:proton antiporter [Escherichia coli]|nr:cation:proton antiporter [Escherichia coli]